ncbi:MAG: sigma-70 family RNA polymerase sigma factor [Flavobacteriales bacterium]|nr:sigma-70 family RNA polymerase sigma factor [Flavobacteriales bacterium]
MQLINKAATGDRRAQAQLYQDSFGLVMNVCMRFCNNREEGTALLNEVFLKILGHLSDVRDVPHYLAWSRRIAMNVCISDLRKKKTHLEMSILDERNTEWLERYLYDKEPEDQGPNEESIREALRQALLSVPSASREVFQLFVMEGYTHYDIAKELGISEGTSKWHVNNARKVIRHQLKEMLRVNLAV